MSAPTIAPYFPFRRIKIINQQVLPNATEARIQAQPDKRFQPICQCCGQKASGIHSWTQRTIRDLNLATAKVWITCQYRKLFCAKCHQICIEDLEPVSSLSAGDPPAGDLHSPAVSVYDRHRRRPAHGTGLENSQKHRQMVFRTSIRSTRLRRAASFSGGRNIGKKRPPLLDRGLGLSQRPCGLCRQRSQIQNAGNYFSIN